MSIAKLLRAITLASAMLLASMNYASAYTLSGTPGGKFFTSYEFELTEAATYTAFLDDLKGSFMIFDDTPVLLDFLGTLGAPKMTSGILAAGDYTVIFTGKGSPDAFYYFDLAAIPEPSTMGMMLAGLGMLGMVAVRRRNAL